ncbi:TPA: lipopolysaccharide biosynthesis protein [Streptococcus suis]
MKKAAIINASGKYSKVILSLIVNAILARILSAEDYGIVAIITVFSTFFTTFSDMGFGAAIVQKKNLTEDEINDIYSFSVYVSIALMIGFVIFSYLIAYFYKNDVFIGLGRLLSLSLLFNSLNMVPNGLLSKEKRFSTIAIRTVTVYVISSILVILFAIFGFSYYALAMETVLTAFLTFLWNYSTLKLKFKKRFDFGSIKGILHYSGFQFGFNIINYFSRNLDNLLTGRIFGSAQLGYYSKAYTLMLYPVNNLSGVITPVIHPILSEFQDDLKLVYLKFIKVLKILFCLGVYVGPLCFLASEEMIGILYGPNWSISAECFKILSLAIIGQMVNSCAGGVFQAIGNTKLLFINGIVNTIITIIAIFLGVFYGQSIIGLSWCVTIAYLLHFCITFYMLIHLGFRFSILDFIRDLLPEIILIITMYGACFVYPFIIKNDISSLLSKSTYLGIIYIIFMLITGEMKLFRQFFRRG